MNGKDKIVREIQVDFLIKQALKTITEELGLQITISDATWGRISICNESLKEVEFDYTEIRK